MTTRITVSCDGQWPGSPPMDCRGALPTGAATAGHARVTAMQAGWWVSLDGADLCPAHARIHTETHRQGTT